ncbi:MAG: hypothetical protein WBF93_16905 [Pirellulales bacterium]
MPPKLPGEIAIYLRPVVTGTHQVVNGAAGDIPLGSFQSSQDALASNPADLRSATADLRSATADLRLAATCIQPLSVPFEAPRGRLIASSNVTGAGCQVTLARTGRDHLRAQGQIGTVVFSVARGNEFVDGNNSE